MRQVEQENPMDIKLRLQGKVIAMLKTVYDPEVPVDIYELGLIYKIDIDDEYNLKIDMTMTAPSSASSANAPKKRVKPRGTTLRYSYQKSSTSPNRYNSLALSFIERNHLTTQRS